MKKNPNFKPNNNIFSRIPHNSNAPKENKIIERLLDITYSIINIYTNLPTAELSNNKILFQQLLEELKECIKIENKIYEELLKEIKDTNNIERLIRKINYKNDYRQSTEDNQFKDLVIERISMYLRTKNYINPFLSMNENLQERRQENLDAITVQYNFDFAYTLIELYNKKISESSLPERNMLTTIKYNVISTEKTLELDLLKIPMIVPEISGRERAILFNQDKDEIEKAYFDASAYLIEHIIQEITVIANNIEYFQQLPHYKFIRLGKLIELECCLTILTYDQIRTLYHNVLYNIILNNKVPIPEIVNDCLDIFKKHLKSKGKKLVGS